MLGGFAGIVVVVSGFDWDESVTDKRLWLGSSPPTKPSNGNGNGNGNGHSTARTNGNGTNGGTNGSSVRGNGTNGNGNGKGVSRGVLTAPSAKESIQAALGSEFEFLSGQNVPCLMFEHGRKFTLKVMHALVWKHAGADSSAPFN